MRRILPWSVESKYKKSLWLLRNTHSRGFWDSWMNSSLLSSCFVSSMISAKKKTHTRLDDDAVDGSKTGLGDVCCIFLWVKKSSFSHNHKCLIPALNLCSLIQHRRFIRINVNFFTKIVPLFHSRFTIVLVKQLYFDFSVVLNTWRYIFDSWAWQKPRSRLFSL